jgi:hypothetical protein
VRVGRIVTERSEPAIFTGPVPELLAPTALRARVPRSPKPPRLGGRVLGGYQAATGRNVPESPPTQFRDLDPATSWDTPYGLHALEGNSIVLEPATYLDLRLLACASALNAQLKNLVLNCNRRLCICSTDVHVTAPVSFNHLHLVSGCILFTRVCLFFRICILRVQSFRFVFVASYLSILVN